jgi:hypothetical protein
MTIPTTDQKIDQVLSILTTFVTKQEAFNNNQIAFNTKQEAFNNNQIAFNTKQEAFNTKQEAFNNNQIAFNTKQEDFNENQLAFNQIMMEFQKNTDKRFDRLESMMEDRFEDVDMQNKVTHKLLMQAFEHITDLQTSGHHH